VNTSQTRATLLFIDDLRELWRRAGNPAFGELAGYSHHAGYSLHKVSETTLRRLISRHRASMRMPPWVLVDAFVTACRTAAESTDIDTGELGTLEEWKARWQSAKNGDLGSASIFEPTVQLRALDAEGEWGLEESIEEILQRLEKGLSIELKSMTRYTARLIAISGPKFGALYKVEKNITTIGRHPGCDILLLDDSVSHWHAKIIRYGAQFTIRDEGSLNGIARRNILIKDSVLWSYDELRIGKLRFLFVQGGDVKGFRSATYGPARRSLIQDITASTTEVERPDSPDDDDGDMGGDG
jgi:hypothetical protein